MAETVLLLLKITMINLILSGDNAVVIAMASRNLPVAQRKQAIFWGTLGAVILRIVLTIGAAYLLQIPYIQGIGSLLLLYIAVKLLNEQKDEIGAARAGTIMSAVGVILSADFVMSLDNVLAVAAAANGNMLLMGIGVVISIPMVVLGSAAIMKLLNRFPIVVWIGAGMLGYTAGEMLMRDDRLIHFLCIADGAATRRIPILGVCAVFIAGFILSIRRKRASITATHRNQKITENMFNK